MDSAWRTCENPWLGLPPTRCVGGSSAASSGCFSSRSRSARKRTSNSWFGNLRRCFVVIEPVVLLNLPAQPLRSALGVFDLFLGHRSIQSQVRPKPHRRSPPSSRQDRRPSDPGYRAGEAHPALQSRRSHTARHITVSIPVSPVSSSTPTREEILQ
jgi:hypothetical protein